MDQLKELLPKIKAHSFWGLVIGILLVTLVSWWISTGNLAAHQKSQKDDINGKFAALDGVKKNNPLHPNPATNTGMDDLTTKYAWDIHNGWDLQYRRQASVLMWPASFRDDKDFMTAVDKCKPIESVPINDKGQVPFDRDIPQRQRVYYRNYVGDDLPDLAKIIGGRWLAVIPGTLADPASAAPGYESGFAPGVPGGVPACRCRSDPTVCRCMLTTQSSCGIPRISRNC